MKLLMMQQAGEPHIGVATERGVVDVTAAARAHGAPLPETVDAVIAAGEPALAQVRALVAGARVFIPEEDITFLPPVLRPGKIVCVGLNYRQHAAEANLPVPNYPIYFSKYATSLSAHCQEVTIPPHVERTDYEVELVTVIGRRASRVSAADALGHVFGYATGNDLSARDLQFRTREWTYGKALDGYGPLGPYIVTADAVPDPQNLTLRCWVNGELRQHSHTGDMIFPVAALIADLSQVITLEPGDLIYTGTPAGVIHGMADPVWLKPGDEVVCEVEGLGRLVTILKAP